MVQGATRWVDYAAATATGGRRVHNEDAFGVYEDAHVFVVADGCGGRSCGENASRTAVACFDPRGDGRDGDVAPVGVDVDPLVRAVHRANARIFAESERRPDRRGQGTTVAAVRVTPGWLDIVHVGDCRVGRLRDDGIEWLTEDHTLLWALRRSGASPAQVAEAAEHHAHAILRAVGVRESVEVELNRVPSAEPALLLLCTDGVTGQVPDSHLASLLGDATRSLEERCMALLDAAEAAGGQDNATAMILRIPG